MEQTLVASLSELKQALKDDPRVKRLNEREEKLLLDPEVVELIKTKNLLEDDYETLLSYTKPSEEASERAQKALYEAKLALDTHPLVKEYNDAYLEVRDLYLEIDDILFGEFRSKTLSSEAK